MFLVESFSKKELWAIKKGFDDIKNSKGTEIKDISNIWESIL